MHDAFKLAPIALAFAGAGSFSAAAAPVAGVSHPAASMVEQAQFYWNDHQYCFYEDGWHGPGWYMCGYAWRRGYGWGGGRGWDRRFHDEGRREYREPPRDHREMDRRRDYDRGDRGDRRGGEGGMR
jgi:hypothetical protein